MLRRLTCSLAGIAVGVFMPILAQAITVTKLYQTSMPVMSQSDDERAQAVRQGFLQLLVKLTGNQTIEKNPDIKAALQRADYYISEYSYSLPTPQSATYHLNVRFEPADVNRMLRKSGITFWGDKRPLILVWLAVTNHHGTEIIGSETNGEVLDSMTHEGKKLGLPLIFPLMDVADMSHVSAEDVQTMSLASLLEAGKRYSPSAYLIGTITQADDGYASEWELVMNKNHWKWNIDEKSTDDIIASVLNETSQTLIKYYGIRS